MPVYKIVYAPIQRIGPSVINAQSPEHARRLFGAGLSEADKALIVVQELRANEDSTRADLRRMAA